MTVGCCSAAAAAAVCLNRLLLLKLIQNFFLLVLLVWDKILCVAGDYGNENLSQVKKLAVFDNETDMIRLVIL
ncbi:CLUMA_CG010249, isoform A [Clunio marinus]|uniref:CLUMA_CG010249, isoform A n=1 Tax=Clunio marinus TaxID=568069 RepID=A0A1J1ICV6_9DIPT|nr:CLUMA_CG010249, isoform A [Clunio marinus]